MPSVPAVGVYVRCHTGKRASSIIFENSFSTHQLILVSLVLLCIMHIGDIIISFYDYHNSAYRLWKYLLCTRHQSCYCPQCASFQVLSTLALFLMWVMACSMWLQLICEHEKENADISLNSLFPLCMDLLLVTHIASGVGIVIEHSLSYIKSRLFLSSWALTHFI
jgi:hypothetical protein